jgi:hypothetical protein
MSFLVFDLPKENLAIGRHNMKVGLFEEVLEIEFRVQRFVVGKIILKLLFFWYFE